MWRTRIDSALVRREHLKACCIVRGGKLERITATAWLQKHGRTKKPTTMKSARLLTVLLIGLVAGTASQGHAEPVTLRFEAEVDGVNRVSDFDPGFQVAQGDVIVGTLSFEQPLGAVISDGVNPDRISTDHAQLKIHIGKVALSTLTFELTSLDNSSIQEFPPASLIDIITGAGGGHLPQMDDSSGFISRLFLYGDATTQSAVSIPASPEKWNDYLLRRRLSLTLRHGLGGVISVGSTVREFTSIPEASSASLLCFAAISVPYFVPLRTKITKRFT